MIRSFYKIIYTDNNGSYTPLVPAYCLIKKGEIAIGFTLTEIPHGRSKWMKSIYMLHSTLRM